MHTSAVARRSRKRRSVVLIVVLWITAVLSMMAYSVIYQATLETRLTSVRKRSLQAEPLAHLVDLVGRQVEGAVGVDAHRA